MFSIFIIIRVDFDTTFTSPSSADGIRIMSRVSDKEIELNRIGGWKAIYLKGVDMGAAKPGAFPGDFAVTKTEYLRWFDEIAAMNANTIRVYTILGPDFYEAFKNYNENHLKKLYLIQGVWVNEEDILSKMDAFSPVIIDEFRKDTLLTIDVIHGNAEIKKVKGEAGGTYTSDVSRWTIGYILGIEWDGIFVQNTDELHSGMPDYSGTYLKTEHASPFEIFLAMSGEAAIAYETEKYKEQRLIAFSNWPTTDPLYHTSEEGSVNLGEVDVEHIDATSRFYSGQFASYHVYPYYPDFLKYQQVYQKPFPDGSVNPYKAYLQKLNAHHSMPVVISEYGVPTSRGIASSQKPNGYDQGNLSEKEQGKILAELTGIIHDAGFAGGLIFTWQDEWFKRTWNTMDFSLPDYRAYWSDAQTNEQSFGLLTFDPGRKRSVCYVDGDTREWSDDDILEKNGDITLSVKSDEKYLYLRINKPDLDLDRDKLLIPIDITSKSGITKSAGYGINFARSSDFLIRINGKKNSAIQVHDYYDIFTYAYASPLFHIDPYSLHFQKNTGDFVNIYLALRRPLLVEATGKMSAPEFFETGRLRYGNANPSSSNYNSIADFCAAENDIEIRIPWGIMNIMDPSSKQLMDDFYSLKGIEPLSFDKIYFGIAKSGEKDAVRMVPYDYQPWEEPSYHERLKESYQAVKHAFRDLN